MMEIRHGDERSGGCAYAALGSELTRATPEARGVVTDGLKTLIATLEEKAPGRSAEARRQKAVTAWAMMIGALMLSRSSMTKSCRRKS
jgi:TetR/AcrR family transcriptional repressor of nem operon